MLETIKSTTIRKRNRLSIRPVQLGHCKALQVLDMMIVINSCTVLLYCTTVVVFNNEQAYESQWPMVNAVSLLVIWLSMRLDTFA